MKEFDKYITISFKYGGCKHNYKIDKKEIEIHEDNNVWFSYFDFGKYHFEVWGGLDDDCRSNMCDWSVTADVRWKNQRGQYKEYMGGCCHDEVAKHFPE